MDILQDLNLGVPSGLKTTDKQSLADITNLAVADSDTIKTNVVNALNSVNTGTALGITTASLWTTIISKIPSVSTGKKYATGTITSGSAITVHGLTFQPQKIEMYLPTTDSTYRQCYVVVDFTTFPVMATGGYNSIEISNYNGSLSSNFGSAYSIQYSDGFGYTLQNTSFVGKTFTYFAYGA